MEAKLYQNVPNPFSDPINTTFRVTLPFSAKEAYIDFLQGDIIVNRRELEQRGDFTFKLNIGIVPSGTYGCRLYVDGTLINEVEMISVP